MLRLLLIASLLYLAISQDEPTTTSTPDVMTHAHQHHSRSPRPDVEPNENEHFNFKYDGHTNEIVVTHEHTCYIIVLSDSERAAVHTDIGLRTLELKLLGMLNTAPKTEVQDTDLKQNILHACGANRTHTYYRLNM